MFIYVFLLRETLEERAQSQTSDSAYPRAICVRSDWMRRLICISKPNNRINPH